MKLQVKGNYIYVTIWDKQRKRPRRFYLGKKEELQNLEKLLSFANNLKVTREEIRDYLNFYLDKETGLTKEEYVMLALELNNLWSGDTGSQ
ncbi:hypothetical protein [Metallosphaera javensis (ex Sakai et al. 2022)]|uniref:hypothetical protein n=1 Tax=Metallosphaera javensis (ex Sakai et al. 2022) TaxID=2775498 RepID=UPI00258C8366|nr:MAG: hypothetical protein MjAS7_1259 [Metallosphaera javensis (ex Sakai et al. 2022)]